MGGLASTVAALALLQSEPAAPARTQEPAEVERPAESPAATDDPSPRPSPPLRGGEGEYPAPAPAAAKTSTSTRTRTAAPTPASTATSSPTATPGSPPSPTPSPTSSPAAPHVRVDPALERGEAEKAARVFLDALAANDAAGLAAASADRFSFDGDTVAGRDAIRTQWRALLAGRAGPPPRVGAVEVLPAADAVARLGKPPARVAPLARPGAWVALADVGGRKVVLFVVREGGRMAVLGMHD